MLQVTLREPVRTLGNRANGARCMAKQKVSYGDGQQTHHDGGYRNAYNNPVDVRLHPRRRDGDACRPDNTF